MSTRLSVIAGLGNPGTKYDKTRHNIGFDIVDFIANRLDVKVDSMKWNAFYAKARYRSGQIIFVKPDTYMNLSGRALRQVLDFHKCSPTDLLVIHDDIDMSFGRLKLVKKGGAGGHNGIKSIISEVGSPDFFRLKFGIGRPGKDEVNQNIPVDRYVLSRFTPEERKHIEEQFPSIEEGILRWLDGDISGAQGLINTIRGGD